MDLLQNAPATEEPWRRNSEDKGRGYATEPNNYRAADIMVIDKKGHQHQQQQQHQQHEPGVSPRAKTCLDLPTTRYQDIR